MIKIGIPKETLSTERRVAAVPETVAKMVKAGMEVIVTSEAGIRSFITDKAYEDAGAKIEKEQARVFEQADVILKVQRPLVDEASGKHEIDHMRDKSTFIGAFYPSRFPDLVKQFQKKQITSFSLEFLPRIARAQPMDILSSMSNLAGYKSVITAANHLLKIFPMLTTAAGTILPAKVIVIGAGVAGLQAIATARRLGGVVLGFDTRPATAEQVKSLGADFVSLETTHEQAEDTGGYAKEQSADFYKNEQSIIQKYLADVDVIITTALIPGKPAPLLITKEMVQSMKPGSVIIDLAAEQGGNCALTEPGKTIEKHQITIIGMENVPSMLASNASQLYSKNLYAFLSYIAEQLEKDTFNFDDEIVKNCLVTYKGDIVHPVIQEIMKMKEPNHAK